MRSIIIATFFALTVTACGLIQTSDETDTLCDRAEAAAEAWVSGDPVAPDSPAFEADRDGDTFIDQGEAEKAVRACLRSAGDDIVAELKRRLIDAITGGIAANRIALQMTSEEPDLETDAGRAAYLSRYVNDFGE